MTRFSHTDDVGRGAWLGPRLSGAWGSVGGIVPTGFDRYLRIFHPLSVRDGADSSWRSCCLRQGKIWHPLMQWNSISGTEQDEAAPYIGALTETAWVSLAEALARRWSEPVPVTVGLWEGYGQIAAPGDAEDRGWRTDFGTDVRSGPMLDLPGRRYALFTGVLGTMEQPDWRRRSGWAFVWDETVNLAWPEDHRWCVASEIDFDSTLVGCDQATAERLFRSGLEIAAVRPEDDLSIAGDVINQKA